MREFHLQAVQAFLCFVFLILLCTLIFALAPLPSFQFTDLSSTNPLPNPTDHHDAFDPLTQLARPVRYDLSIFPDLPNALFRGNATITFSASSPVSSVWLHVGANIIFDAPAYPVTRFPPSDDARVDLPGNFSGIFSLHFT
jgi:hypothetical protein